MLNPERTADMKTRSFVALCLLTALTGFGFSAPAAAQPSSLEIVGTGDGIDVLQALAAEFGNHEKSIQVDIPPSIGSGGGIAAVGSGKATLGRIARKLSPAESATGIVYKPFARLPSAFFVNSSSGVTSLTTKQLLAVYSGDVTNWKEVGGADLRIRVVRREDADSTLTGLRAAMPGWKDLVITDKSKVATTTQEAIETVREVPGTIGFGPFSRTLENGMTVLKIDGRYPNDPQYPSSVELALIYKDATVTPQARKFIDFVTMPKARGIIANMGNIPAS
jgi:phosphate transport system substrate-binding protein